MPTHKERHLAWDVVLWGVPWYWRNGFSYQNPQQMLGDRRVDADHSAVYYRVQGYTSEIAKRLGSNWRRPAPLNWRVVDTYVKLNGVWTYLDCEVHKHYIIHNLDFCLILIARTAKRFIGNLLNGLMELRKLVFNNSDMVPTYTAAIAVQI